MQSLSVSEPSTNPWQPALDKPTKPPPPIPSLPRESSGNEAWAAPPARAPPHPSVDTSQPVLVDLDEPESPAWDEDEPSPVVQEMPTDHSASIQQINEGAHAWDDQGHPLQQHPVGQTGPQDEPPQGEPWNLVDHEAMPMGAQESGVIGGSGQVLDSDREEHAPALPPRRSEEQPPQQPPRPQATSNTGESGSSLLSPSAGRQKNQTYEIKKITWHDANAVSNPRISPILIQNANGPCPLLALVNALTLSTPANEETALVETLRSREQVSLGLLLDAVFDELMSGRRGNAAHGLPDVGDLYKFLLTLHTGMNVNPRFIPSPANNESNDPRNSMSHVHPSEREVSLPGTFEDTREMKLYSTFYIPLIHGWLPEAGSPALAALKRSAQSYEDAQNLMFHEEVLEDKLRTEGLSFEEQATLEDIATIKAFFASNATQLTNHGLNTIALSMAPGSVAILFRNDHFSTLYRHPTSLQLVQLVTDHGYAGHEEVVWESLVDVNGENAEFFSGDFRLVGGTPSTSDTNVDHAGGWTTVTDRRGGSTQRTEHTTISSNSPQPPQSPTEQEDHDFALAMQLQEEEEERVRIENTRRQRESDLSQQYIEQQGQTNNNIPVSQRGGGTPTRGRGRGATPGRINTDTPESRPIIPPRRNNTGTTAAQAPPNRDPEAGIDAPPPTYEQSANTPAYEPPADHPAHASASPTTSRRESAYSSNSASVGRGSVGRGARRGTLSEQIPGRMGRGGPGMQPEGSQGQGRDKDCVVM